MVSSFRKEQFLKIRTGSRDRIENLSEIPLLSQAYRALLQGLNRADSGKLRKIPPRRAKQRPAGRRLLNAVPETASFWAATIRHVRALVRRQIQWSAKWTPKRNTRSRCWR
jgi:hypothetical protein